MPEYELASQVDQTIAIGIVVAVAVFRSASFAGGLVIGVIIDIARRPVIPERLIKIVCAGRVALTGLFFAQLIGKVRLHVIIGPLRKVDGHRQELLDQLPVVDTGG